MKLRILTILSVLVVSLFVAVPMAHAQDCDGVGIAGGAILGDICLDAFPSFGGASQGGLLSAIANLFQLLLVLIGVFWVISLMLLAWDNVVSEGNPEVVGKTSTYVMYFFRGTSLIFIVFVLISVLGYMGGLGNPLKWADELGQCGLDPDREILMRAKDRFLADINSTTNPGDMLPVYCCDVDDNQFDGFYTAKVDVAIGTQSEKDFTDLHNAGYAFGQCEKVDEVEVEYKVR